MCYALDVNMPHGESGAMSRLLQRWSVRYALATGAGLLLALLIRHRVRAPGEFDGESETFSVVER
jgi:hypothetical protein